MLPNHDYICVINSQRVPILQSGTRFGRIMESTFLANFNQQVSFLVGWNKGTAHPYLGAMHKGLTMSVPVLGFELASFWVVLEFFGGLSEHFHG